MINQYAYLQPNNKKAPINTDKNMITKIKYKNNYGTNRPTEYL